MYSLNSNKALDDRQANAIPFTSDISQSADFPLYYPKTLPAGFYLKSDSVSLQNGPTVMITYYYEGNKQLIITEQKKPIALEQVTKNKKFDVDVGKAYIADLNGHTAGFVEAENTLIILSSTDNIDSTKLQQIITSFQKAN